MQINWWLVSQRCRSSLTRCLEPTCAKGTFLLSHVHFNSNLIHRDIMIAHLSTDEPTKCMLAYCLHGATEHSVITVSYKFSFSILSLITTVHSFPDWFWNGWNFAKVHSVYFEWKTIQPGGGCQLNSTQKSIQVWWFSGCWNSKWNFKKNRSRQR